jgi:hypothetical protein
MPGASNLFYALQDSVRMARRGICIYGPPSLLWRHVVIVEVIVTDSCPIILAKGIRPSAGKESWPCS